MPSLALSDLRRYAVARSLFKPTTLPKAIARLGFVQADPIRSPARAQDLTLRHRVKGYRAGDLERQYPKLAVEEDFFVNYGFVTPELHARMHPRTARQAWPPERWAQAQEVWHHVQQRGEAHPREVDAHFAHGHTTNWWGGQSKASTQLLDAMHYRGLLRVARRDNGIRLYAAHQPQTAPDDVPAVLDQLVDVLMNKYAPLPQPGLRQLVAMLKHAVPQWQDQLRAALQRAVQRLPHAEVDGVAWYWPADEDPGSRRWKAPEDARLLAPFDPVVWDRNRFERLWGWAYRFEAYTPPAQRVRGYYAMPLLWRDQVIGWGNLSVVEGRLRADLGYVDGQPPKDETFQQALDTELSTMAACLGAERS
ncbi:DNA glycosylase AlkZ-like family protein [Hydrogenophaga sp. A37]|uniref:DNA glycosylase AlkZ-like family protein n=1 Tax=Hydrogenophaga sp. A37 TaxID=1945864 RepID=UPI00098496F8|nr:crosslink repair DNA glycosylase YcaQ family protein [Hydrogenophaga sp. A37]OOG79060.1 cytoplasmic protein [Hydrogenophaga sp. A37]